MSVFSPIKNHVIEEERAESSDDVATSKDIHTMHIADFSQGLLGTSQ